MVAPHVVMCYARTWKCVVKRNNPTEKDMTNFIRDLPLLRDYLSCAVCGKLLDGSSLYSVALCDHFVCKECKGAQREENKICDNCRGWEAFSEDETLVALIAGHTRSCLHFLHSSICTSLLELNQQKNPQADVLKVLNILHEGAKIAASRLNSLTKESDQGLTTVSAKLVVADISPCNSVSEPSIVMRKEPIETNYASRSTFYSSLNFCSSSSSSNVVLSESNFKLKSEKVVENSVDRENEIDVKIEPVFQRHCDEQDEDMESDSDDSSGKKYSNPLNNYKKENNISSGEEEDDDMNDEDNNVSVEDFALEDTEEYLGNSVQPPQPQTSDTNSVVALKISVPIPQTSTISMPPPSMILTTNSSIQKSPLPPPRVSPSPSPMLPSPVIQTPPRQFHSFVLTRPVATGGSQLPNQSLSPGLRLPAGQTIRLARFALSDGRPVTMVRQILNNQSPGGGIRHITFPINTDLMKKKIIVRPGTSAASIQMQRWPDGNAVLQYASGSGAVISQNQNQSKGLVQPSYTAGSPSTITNATMPVVVSSACNIRVSNTNTLTLPQQKVNFGTFTSTSSSSSSSSGTVLNNVRNSPSTPGTITDVSGSVIGTSLVHTQAGTSLPEAIRKTVNKVRLPNKAKNSTKVRSGCRCGAASQPSKLTCCGQRCICYVDSKSCIDCKCRGCNNPYIPGGKKLLQGMNAVIDTKTNTTVPLISGGAVATVGGNFTTVNMGGAVVAPSTSTSAIVNVSVASPAHSTMSLVSMIPSSGTNSVGPQLFTRIHHPGTQPTTTTFSQIIPVANFTNQFGHFIPLPISLISPGNAGHTIQSHSDAIHLQNIQLNPNLQNH